MKIRVAIIAWFVLIVPTIAKAHEWTVLNRSSHTCEPGRNSPDISTPYYAPHVQDHLDSSLHKVEVMQRNPDGTPAIVAVTSTIITGQVLTTLYFSSADLCQ